MADAFRVITGPVGALTLRLGPKSLDDETGELSDFVRRALASGHLSRIVLDASDAERVTLEGIGKLIRLRACVRDAHADLRVAPRHPRLERKLRETGTAGLFGALPSSA